MTTVTIRETFERFYELEVDDLDPQALAEAVDAHNELDDTAPEWVCTAVATGDDDEIIAEW